MLKRIADKVLLIGWDAADWNIIRPLMEKGQMPHLQRLIEVGASGNLASIQPMLSPALWTSIATGKRPHKHGVHGLMEPNPEAGGVRPASSTSRTTKAIWNIMSQNGMKAHVIGWRGAHPAERIDGINVTDHHAVAMAEYGKPWPQPEGSFYPLGIGPTIASLRVHPHQLDCDTLAFFVPDLKKVDLRGLRKLTHCTRWLAATISNHAAATWAMEHHPWDFMAICYSGIEYLSHAFMRYAPPRQEPIPPDDFELYRHVVPACYRFHDRMLGRLLELAGSETTVLLVSDHGCKTGSMWPARLGRLPEDVEAWHRRLGICVVHGPHVKSGATISNASILDITPTILALLGLPVGADMEGQPLGDIFDVPLELPPISSWDSVPGENNQSGVHSSGSADSHRRLQELLDKLKDMGYSDPQEKRLAEIEQDQTARNRFHLARSLIDAGELTDAVEVLEPLAANSPQSTAVAALLIEVYLSLGRYTDARGVVEHLLSEHTSRFLIHMTRGRLELAKRRSEAALGHFHLAEQADAHHPRIHVFSGRACLRLRRWSCARGAFQRTLELEPAHAEALHGLCVVCLAEGNASDALQHATAAINSYEPMPAAHYHRGVALTELGRYDEATAAFQRALCLNPKLRAAQRRLVRLNGGGRGQTARTTASAGDQNNTSTRR